MTETPEKPIKKAANNGAMREDAAVDKDTPFDISSIPDNSNLILFDTCIYLHKRSIYPIITEKNTTYAQTTSMSVADDETADVNTEIGLFSTLLNLCEQ